MKRMVFVVVLSIAAGCSTTASESRARPTRWEGYMLHNGLRSPIAVDLATAENAGEGRLSGGDNAVPLENVRVTDTRVHFELPGEAVFDGTLKDARMAGSVTGCASGSFELTRHDAVLYPYFLGP